MGLLDDAIREHLDLKRRRGADPAEIERDERDALGPVRRNREAAVDGDPEALTAPDDAANGDLDATDPGLPEPVGHPPVGSAFDEPDESIAGDLAEEDDPFADEPVDEEPRTRVMRSTDIPIPGDATTEYDVEEALAAEDSGDGEDVLEETPEFLQDTPDHDRLWFEQRPPRDFDFDG